MSIPVDILTSVIEIAAPLKAAAVISPDGFPLIAENPENLDLERYCARGLMLMKLLNKEMSESGREEAISFTIRTDNDWISFYRIPNRQLYVLFITAVHCDLAFVRLAKRTILGRIAHNETKIPAENNQEKRGDVIDPSSPCFDSSFE